MNNYTIEDYKKAIKAKYEKEKDSDGLSSPSQANLRDLCWEIFEKNRNEDDHIIFSTFFGFPFDVTRKNQFKEYTDKFKPIGTFFKGKTDLSSRSAANLAAILVDFEHRPFKKFKEKGFVEEELQHNNFKSSELFIVAKEVESYRELNPEEKVDLEEVRNILKRSKKGYLFSNLKEKAVNQFKKNIKGIAVAFVVVFCIGFALVDKAFTKKKCMQWSVDHYEIVNCDLKTAGLGTVNNIELFDKDLINLKKIKVYDTTACFDKNGEPTVWYAKTLTGVEFFNASGRHPENGTSLKPVTRYILNKYVKKESRFNAKI